MKVFRSHGKLLLSGEYAVLDGAVALAVPTRLGQRMEAEEIPEKIILWKSLDPESRTWLETSFSISEIRRERQANPPSEDPKERLRLLLQECWRMNPGCFSSGGWSITTQNEFPLDWGLGSSSTLVTNLSKLFRVDAFRLLDSSFGGSGYDVAVALENRPIMYQLKDSGRSVFSTSFDPDFKDNIFFVHLNQKQNSRHSIAAYKEQEKSNMTSMVQKVSALTQQFIHCKTLEEFELLLSIHENVISRTTGFKKVKSLLFPDFPGQVKSLGGWGGDFIMATGSSKSMEFFKKKGYTTVIPYTEMIM